MSARKPRERIEIDTLFAPLPQDLLLDTRVSAPACRLWGVLYVFRWNNQDPDFAALAAAMNTTERSVYRWLQELTDAGWIDWDRHAALQDRFTLRTAPGGTDLIVRSNSDDPKLTPGSNDLTPRSEDLIVVSERLTQVSILDDFPGVQTPQTDPTQNHENHENHESPIDRSVGDTLARHLIDRGVNHKTAQEIADRSADADTTIQSLDHMLADAMAVGETADMGIRRFVTRFRLSPPQKGKPYERRLSQPDVSQDRPGRRIPRDTGRADPGRAELDRFLAQLGGGD